MNDSDTVLRYAILSDLPDEQAEAAIAIAAILAAHFPRHPEPKREEAT